MTESYATDLPDYAEREIAEDVAEVIDAVRRRGDAAVGELAARAHDVSGLPRRVGAAEVARCVAELAADTVLALREAADQVGAFAATQRMSLRACESPPAGGVIHGLRHVPVQSAAVFVSPPRRDLRPELPSFHAALVLARCAGVHRVVACVRPVGGAVQAQFVAAAHLAGADEIHLVDGVPAVAGLALGTESLPRVDVVVGGGDRLTAEACRQLFRDRAHHVCTGSGDILIIADEAAEAGTVVDELRSAMTDDADAGVVLVTPSAPLAADVQAVMSMAADADRTAAGGAGWRQRGAVRLVADPRAACALADRYGTAQVRILSETPHWYLEHLQRCSEVTLGGDRPGTRAAMAGAFAPAVDPASPRHHRALWVGHFMRVVSYRQRAGAAADGEAAVQMPALAGALPG